VGYYPYELIGKEQPIHESMQVMCALESIVEKGPAPRETNDDAKEDNLYLNLPVDDFRLPGKGCN
jgi:hypothetical protein